MAIIEILVGVVVFLFGLVYYSEEIVHIYEFASDTYKRPWFTLSLLLVVVLGAIGAIGGILLWNHE